ncbi:MAG: peptidoglycan DD-metalloendopeptidase family protein [Flavobacteriia bacterium]|nr:peptidoglycan DD-metalloendopeptidase family protein [Flavobacteriia bacterium]
MKYYVFSIIIFCYFNSFSQFIVDTVETDQGKIVLYSDRSWELLSDIGFDGIMNEEIYEKFSSDTNYNFVQTWDNETCFTSERNNDMSKLKDTLWLCVGDSIHSKFVMPFNGFVTSHYGFRKGRYHNGIDIDLNTGDTIRSCWSGKVRYAKYNEGGFGNLVIIRHYNGLETFYAHLSKFLVASNSEVKAGDPIALGGNTGRSRGSHLHFEMRFYDAPMNPEEIIDVYNKNLKDQNLFVHKGLFRPGAKPTDFYDGHSEHSASIASVSSPKNRKYYKVRSGDTLSQIAVRNNTTITKLCQINGIRRNTTLQIGKQLRVR